MRAAVQVVQSLGFDINQEFPIFADRMPTQLLAFLRLSRLQDSGELAKVRVALPDVFISESLFMFIHTIFLSLLLYMSMVVWTLSSFVIQSELMWQIIPVSRLYPLPIAGRRRRLNMACTQVSTYHGNQACLETCSLVHGCLCVWVCECGKKMLNIIVLSISLPQTMVPSRM